MSRMQKFSNWLSKGYNMATLGDYLTDWSPNNIKTIVISGRNVAVEFFVPDETLGRCAMTQVEDTELDLKALEADKMVKSMLKALNQYQIFNNLEEIIITTEGYNKQLFRIDADLSSLYINNVLVFNRLYSVTKTNIGFNDIWAMMKQTAQESHIHYSDLLEENKTSKYLTKQLQIQHFNKDNWCQHIVLTDTYYEMDKADGALASYLKDVLIAVAGEVGFNDIVEKEDSLTDFFQTISVSELNLPKIEPIKVVTPTLQFIRSDLYNPDMSGAKVRYLLKDSLLEAIEANFGSYYAVNELRITSGNQLIINNVRVSPLLSYVNLMQLPDSLFKVLCGETKEQFNSRVQIYFKRIPDLDADIAEFEEWLSRQQLNWGYIFSFKDIALFTNISAIKLNNPYRAVMAKIEAGVQSWSALYNKLPSLLLDGLYIDGAYINQNTEIVFMNLEKAIEAARQLVLDSNVSGYIMPQVMVVETDNAVSGAVSKIFGAKVGNTLKDKMANLSAKATTLYRKFDI